MKKRRSFSRKLTIFLVGLFLVAITIGSGCYLYLRECVIQPPSPPTDISITRLPTEVRDGRVYLGKNWFGNKDGLKVLYLTGSPFERGYANGKLTQELIHRQEQVVIDLVNTMLPQWWQQIAARSLVIFQTRSLKKYVSQEIQMEILGMTYGCPDQRPQDGPYFHRLLGYHAAQDVSYMFMHYPLLRGGCTGFAAWGNATTGKHLLYGRNFDWEAAPVFDEDRILILCEPDQGIPFISLAWAGMAGCVTGMNREGICVAVNGAPSHLPTHDARTPTCMVAREILQYAHTLDEATDIIRRSDVFVSALFLIGSRRDGRFVVVEKTPLQTTLQPASTDDFIVHANHYQTSPMKDDPLNIDYMQNDTSIDRATRMEELLKKYYGILDTEKSVAILRDRKLPGDVFAGNGHRSSLNPMIATHSAVMDLTEGIFWAACPPHQLGKFVAFDVNDFNREVPHGIIAADSFAYNEYLNSQKALGDGRDAFKHKDYTKAIESAHKAEQWNPGFYKNSWLLGESLLQQGDKITARRALLKAQEGKPALGKERRKIKELLQMTQP